MPIMININEIKQSKSFVCYKTDELYALKEFHFNLDGVQLIEANDNEEASVFKRTKKCIATPNNMIEMNEYYYVICNEIYQDKLLQ